jgi:DNA-binding MarR family transcriptional regulator
MNAILTNPKATGLVVRRPRPKLGGVLQVCLTEMGEESVARAHEIGEAVERRMLAELGQDDRRRLLKALRSCADTLERGAEGEAAGA